MENNQEKNKNIENIEKKVKKKSFFRKNWLLIILPILTIGVILVDKHDKENTETINTKINHKLIQESEKNENLKEKINVFVYNKETKIIEEKEVYVSKQINLVEGDYINEIIKNSPFVTDEMKFISGYNLKMEGKETLIIKLNSEFLPLKMETELYNGFSQSIIQTMKKYNPKLENIQIQIDGDKFVQ